MDREKEALIKRIYYDVNTGFGSLSKVHAQARRVDPSVKRSDVKKVLDKQVVRQRKKPNRYNSFIPSQHRQQFQIDLADFGDGGPWRYAFVCIDVFSKLLAAVPLKGKSSQETSEALDTVLEDLSHPITILTDEGGEFQLNFKNRLGYYDIEHIVTRTPPIFVERVIRTLREGINKRLQATRLKKTEWWRYLEPVVQQYNNDTHTTIGMTPADASRNENRQETLESIMRHAINNRKYPELEVGDMVKVIRKPGKYSEYKTSFIAWSDRIHNVVEVVPANSGLRTYRLDGVSRPLMRHELLRVDGVEQPPLRRVAGKQPTAALLQQNQLLQPTVAEQARTASAMPGIGEIRRRISGKTSIASLNAMRQRQQQARINIPNVAGVAASSSADRPSALRATNISDARTVNAGEALRRIHEARRARILAGTFAG